MCLRPSSFSKEGRGLVLSRCTGEEMNAVKLYLVINPIQARLFGAAVDRGHIVAPFENHVPLVLTVYCSVILKAGPKLDQWAPSWPG